MGKILSVSIASYNVEKFIRKALDSCCVPEIMDRLEVLVVNDGSTDSTLEIAREYEEKYPQTFRVIDKKNGGYGSTVNASIKAATGKYFRLLDGDDWFDRDGLVSFIEELTVAEEDMIVAQFKNMTCCLFPGWIRSASSRRLSIATASAAASRASAPRAWKNTIMTRLSCSNASTQSILMSENRRLPGTSIFSTTLSCAPSCRSRSSW